MLSNINILILFLLGHLLSMTDNIFVEFQMILVTIDLSFSWKCMNLKKSHTNFEQKSYF